MGSTRSCCSTQDSRSCQSCSSVSCCCWPGIENAFFSHPTLTSIAKPASHPLLQSIRCFLHRYIPLTGLRCIEIPLLAQNPLRCDASMLFYSETRDRLSRSRNPEVAATIRERQLATSPNTTL